MLYLSAGKPAEGKISVKANAATTLIVPSTARAVPQAIISNIGSSLTRQLLLRLLPRFLKQVEQDFDQWSKCHAIDN